jgi:RNA 3'-terminal phosphate cyclase (ATP)
MIDIDGSLGEGGGQILRTALAAAIITRTPVRMHSIRARRKKPGLLRQHLTAVQAAIAVGGARVEGASLGSSELLFEPSAICHGRHRFAVGTAGSATLVLQTVMWPLLVEPGESEVIVEGGTHNPLAPPFEFLAHVLVPRLRAMGAELELHLEAAGFYPAGGGKVRLRVAGGRSLRPVEWLERGPIREERAVAILSNLPTHVARRELDVVRERLGLREHALEVRNLPTPGPGNALEIVAEFPDGCEIVTAFGEKGRPAEAVAEHAVDEYVRWRDADVPVGEHLADQLLMPLAIAGGGAFFTCTPTEHTRTNAELVQRMLGPTITIEDGDRVLVTVTRTAPESHR